MNVLDNCASARLLLHSNSFYETFPKHLNKWIYKSKIIIVIIIKPRDEIHDTDVYKTLAIVFSLCRATRVPCVSALQIVFSL